MFWTRCHVCECTTVATSRPYPVVSFAYDLKGQRRERFVKLGVIFLDCDRKRISFDSVQVIVKELTGKKE